LRRLLLLAAVVPVLAGCTIERRADPNEVPVDLALGEVDTLGFPAAPPDPGASVEVTLEIFREAVRVGDLGLALQLLDPQAVLVDDLATGGTSPDRVATPATRGELLLELRRRHAAGLLLDPVDSELAWVDEVAIVTTRLRLLARSPDPEIEPEPVGEARESAVLRPTPEGWRIVHLHRSLVPPEP
jgi:hypothetical protein